METASIVLTSVPLFESSNSVPKQFDLGRTIYSSSMSHVTKLSYFIAGNFAFGRFFEIELINVVIFSLFWLTEV